MKAMRLTRWVALARTREEYLQGLAPELRRGSRDAHEEGVRGQSPPCARWLRPHVVSRGRTRWSPVSQPSRRVTTPVTSRAS